MSSHQMAPNLVYIIQESSRYPGPADIYMLYDDRSVDVGKYALIGFA